MSAAQDTKNHPKPLSAKAVEALKPGVKVITDCGENTGLRVKCGVTGVKTFFYRYLSPETGKQAQVKIGNYPDTSLSVARMELEKLKRLRKAGVCPKAERTRIVEGEKAETLQKQQAIKRKEFTVTDLVDLYLAGYIEDRYVSDKRNPDKKKKVPGARKPKGQAEVRRTLYGDAVRVLGNRPANEVTRKEVVQMVMAVVERGAKVQGGNVLRELSSAYEYAIGLEHFADEFANPALLAKASLKQARVKLTSNKGRRVLSDKELSALLEWLPGSGFSNTQKNVIRFTLWTGCRTGEVCAAKWADIDLESQTWHMRDSKNGAERYVQLPDQAVSFLRQLKLNAHDYLFSSSRTGKAIMQKSLTEAKWSMRNPEKMTNRRKFKEEEFWLDTIEDWSPHDLRRSVRTGLSRMRCPSEVAEAILGHSRKGIEGTYDLHGYENECCEWLQQWADHLSSLAVDK